VLAMVNCYRYRYHSVIFIDGVTIQDKTTFSISSLILFT